MTLNGPRDSCRSCGALIVWALTAKGKRIPMDPEPVADGNVVVTGTIQMGRDAGTRTTHTLSERELQELHLGLLKPFPPTPDNDRYVSHFKTCTDPKAHRRPHA